MKLTRLFRSDRTKKAFDLAQESKETRERYGPTAFGQGRWRRGGWSRRACRFVTISLGGWDTHGQNFTNLKTKLLPPLDQTLSALIEDLDEHGLLD